VFPLLAPQTRRCIRNHGLSEIMPSEKTNTDFTIKELELIGQAGREYRAVGEIMPCDIGHDSGVR
jgi:hypothetical protein